MRRFLMGRRLKHGEHGFESLSDRFGIISLNRFDKIGSAGE
jgi:hypothetical protein